MRYLFSCLGCSTEKEVDQGTFFRFLTRGLSEEFFSEKGQEAQAAALEFETKCPFCSPEGVSDYKLKIARPVEASESQ